MKTLNDLADLLNLANKNIGISKFKPLTPSVLYYHIYNSSNKTKYKEFKIIKKSGKVRTIHAPENDLKVILKSLNYILNQIYKPHEASTGFVLDKSIVTNAKKHVGKKFVYNIDLKDFFYSFDLNRVKLALMNKPFGLNKDKEKLAYGIAKLTTNLHKINDDDKFLLMQGSPTSPTLTNIICYKLDRRLSGLSKRFDLDYTRYADDITFSANHNIFNNKDFKNELERIIKEDNLYKFKDKTIEIGPPLDIQTTKTRLLKPGDRKIVTGLVVNEKVNVRRSYIKQIRMWLYYWENYGYERASYIFKKDYIIEKGHVKDVKSKIENVLDGKIEFLKMVKGSKNKTYIRLKTRLDKLIAKM